MRGRTTIAAVTIAVALLVAGCAGAGSGGAGADVERGGEPTVASGGAGADAAEEPAATRTAAQTAAGAGATGGDAAEDVESAEREAGTGGGDGSVAAERARQRALIRTGQVTLEVEDYDRARSAIVGAVRDLDGFLAGSSVETNRAGNRTWRTGRLVLRVPAEKFPTAMASVKSEGRVLDATTETKDVSDRLVDIEARLENLRAERERLRKFLDRANDTDELLAVERRLTEVQGEIERLKAQKRSLEEQVALSTVRVTIREPRPDPPETTTATPTPYHRRSATGAFADSVALLVRLGRSLVVTVAYLGPFLLAVGLPVAFGLLAYRRGVFGSR